MPQTSEGWKDLSKGFEDTLNANYEFVMVDIGDYGRLSDGSVFSDSHLGLAINSGCLNLPAPRTLGNTTMKHPYVFVGDDGFPFKSCLMKPYPGQRMIKEERITNYRISRACRIVENSFGIASSRFKIFRRPIYANTHTTVAVTNSIVALRNFLIKGKCFESGSQYFPGSLIDQENNGRIQNASWRTECFNQALLQVSNTSSNNYSQLAKEIGDNFKAYFFSENGSVPWQWTVVHVFPWLLQTISFQNQHVNF